MSSVEFAQSPQLLKSARHKCAFLIIDKSTFLYYYFFVKFDLLEAAMKNKVVTFSTTRRSSVTCEETGVIFPQVFRITGNPFKSKDGEEAGGCILRREDVEPDLESWVDPTYTLDSSRIFSQLANMLMTPIQKLEQGLDDGIIFVRHHADEATMSGYLDASYDLRYKVFDDKIMSFKTEFGLFSILRRPAHPGGPNCLLIYSTKIPHAIGEVDWYKVIDSTGNEIDIDDIYSPEDVEYFAPLNAILNPQL